MNIVGIQESFIDYPNEICIMIFTKTCKWNCTRCHNKNNLIHDPVISKDFVYDYLNKSSDLINHITISGGEPTDEKDIVNFVKDLYNKGYKIKLDTNGTNPSVLKELLPYLSVVAMDIKECINSYDKYHRITKCDKDSYLSALLSLDILSDWHKSDTNNYLLLRTTLLDNKIDPDKVKSSLSKYSYTEYKIQDDII